MNIEQFQKNKNITLLPKNKSRLMRFVGFFSKRFMTDFWTTYRLPFGKPIVTYPASVADPLYPYYSATVEHELIHAEDMRSGWGLFCAFWLVWLLPLPVLFSGRWFIERKAYLHNIIKHGYSVDSVVDALWCSYGYAWPPKLMRKWFNKKIKEAQQK